MTAATKAKASKQNPAESQQSESLQEGNLRQSEQRRRQPIPQKLYYFAANRGEDNYPHDCRWSHPNQSLSHVVFPHFFIN